MSSQDAEIKAFAKASRWHGDSYRTIQANVLERFKRNVSTASIWEWCNEDLDEVARFNRHRLAQIIDQDLEIATVTGELVRERIEQESDTFKLVGAYKTSRDQVYTAVKIAEDRRNNNELLDAIRAGLRQKSPQELRSLVLAAPSPPPPVDHSAEIKRYHGLGN